MYQQCFSKKWKACTKQTSSTEWVKTSEVSVWPQWHNPLTSDSLHVWAVTKVTKQVLVINTRKCITSTLLTLHILLLWARKHRETSQKHLYLHFWLWLSDHSFFLCEQLPRFCFQDHSNSRCFIDVSNPRCSAQVAYINKDTQLSSGCRNRAFRLWIVIGFSVINRSLMNCSFLHIWQRDIKVHIYHCHFSLATF